MADERKTLEQRAQMSDIDRLRHSAAHVMATAILRIWPEAQFAAGPPVENGFFYDLEMPHRITPDDFPRIEEEMKKEIKANNVFERQVVSRKEAIALAESGRLGGLSERPGNVSKFKIGNLQDIPEGEEISLFRNGDFLDLCAGPHVMRTGNIGAFKLTHVASAYYKGDEKNPQLQRIYGTAFKSKTEMEAYFTMLEEAMKRDHRKLGKELELFTFDDDVGPGLAMWLPRGTVLIEELEKLAKETEFAAGYQRVRTPHIARENMYLTSGHLPYYADSMFPPMELAETNDMHGERESLREEITDLEERIMRLFRRVAGESKVNIEYYNERGEREDNLAAVQAVRFLETIKDCVAEATALWKRGLLAPDVASLVTDLEQAKKRLADINKTDRYYLKAMNCPHHHKLFGAVPRSYRDLPLRLAEYGTCYRYEQSGELFGLMRVRSMQMNDAHMYCTPEQFEAEFRAVNDMYLKYFQLFGIEKNLMRFSTHDPARLGQKFVDEPELWKQTEEMVRGVLQRSGINYVEVPNEAAFYGPKIDVQVWSAIGREFTIATNQVDFAQPRRFGLTYRDRDNSDKVPLCIHRAPLGTHERFIGFLIEHYAGNFPLWLSPEQVRVLPIGNQDALIQYSQSIVSELRSHGIRAVLDASPDPVKAKIANAEQMKVHTMLVIGQRDLDAGAVSVRVHGKGNLGARSREEVVADLLDAIKTRRA
jgi:threonyl-tRNA synthetase